MVSMFVHLMMVILKEEQGDDAAAGECLFFFQSAGRTWDLLTWNSSKTKKQVQ